MNKDTLIGLLALALPVICGCASDRHAQTGIKSIASLEPAKSTTIKLAAFTAPSTTANLDSHEVPNPATEELLLDLEQQISNNPTLTRLWNEYRAAAAKVHYVDKLPDPTLGANAFAHPIETAAGSQRANLTMSQMLPWLPRLDAQAQKACFEAAAARQLYVSERLRVIAELRTRWFLLYVLQKQIEITNANQDVLTSLIDVATSRVATGAASQSDVLAGTVEYSKLEEQLVALRQRTVSTTTRINRLIGRHAATPVIPPKSLEIELPEWDIDLLMELANSNQPDIEAGRIRKHAARWGVEVARLKRRPDITLNASWFAVDDNRPASQIVTVGEDAWAIGAMMTLPIRHQKYDAIEQEALWRNAAANSSIEEVRQKYDALIVDIWEQAKAADETARLYQSTIIPESKRTLRADQEAYTNGDVEFDRLVEDFRSTLTLELGYHRAIGQLATAIARIEQATGVPLTPNEIGAGQSQADSSQTNGQTSETDDTPELVVPPVPEREPSTN